MVLPFEVVAPCVLERNGEGWTARWERVFVTEHAPGFLGLSQRMWGDSSEPGGTYRGAESLGGGLTTAPLAGREPARKTAQMRAATRTRDSHPIRA